MKPILFNTEMVKALLDGRKTVTRRLMKPQPYISCEGLENECRHEKGFFDTGSNNWACRLSGCGIKMNGKSIYHAPYQVGDILYVRETWSKIEDFTNYAELDIDKNLKYLFKCDDNGKEHSFIDVGVKKWHPSIHMPKEVARIFLKVTGVRAERLQDIDKLWDNYDKEGMRNPEIENISIAMQERFISIWNSTIPKKDPADMYRYGWKANPWVWVIEFERISKEDAYAERD